MKKIDINDPRITQYALGEMDKAEAAGFESEIAGNSEVQKEIEEIRQVSQKLEAVFSEAPDLELTDTRREKIMESAHFSGSNEDAVNNGKSVKRGFNWRIIYSAAAVLMGAFIVELLMKEPGRPAENIPVSHKAAPASHAVVTDKSLHEVPEKGDVVVNDIQTKSLVQENTSVEKMKVVSAGGRRRSMAAKKMLRVNSRRKLYEKRSFCLYSAPSMCIGLPRPPEPIRVDNNFNTENYKKINDNPFRRVSDYPLSTFSIDVDTASYANIRRFINRGALPPKDAVRIEEMINYFSYEYPAPKDGKPFAVNFQIAGCPWAAKHKLVKIGIKGKEIKADKRPDMNLVFLLDVSGSMNSDNKLPLLKKAVRMLVKRLGKKDKVAIVVYAGASGLILPSTPGIEKEKIMQAIERLSAGGSTNGGAGIKLAYKTAVANYIENGVNRVILATDGDFNVGVSSEGELERLITKSAKSGVFLTVLGFGMGNYKDSTLETLADKGNGNYAYIDTENEAKKVLVNDLTANMVTIAKDVKIQVEFNPGFVEAYRLIGYENRVMKKEDFNNDKKDAGEIGAGHTVTALYEIVPKGEKIPGPSVDPLKYQQKAQKAPVKSMKVPAKYANELMTVKLRYKKPDEKKSSLLVYPLENSNRKFESTGRDFKFAAAVAEFGMILRDSKYKEDATFDSAFKLAEEGKGSDPYGYRKEFIQLLKKAKRLKSITE